MDLEELENRLEKGQRVARLVVVIAAVVILIVGLCVCAHSNELGGCPLTYTLDIELPSADSMDKALEAQRKADAIHKDIENFLKRNTEGYILLDKYESNSSSATSGGLEGTTLDRGHD